LIGLGAVLHGDTGPIPKVYTFYGPWHLEMATELRAKPLRPAVRGFYRLYVGLLCRVLRGWQGRVMRRCDRVIVLSKHSRKEIAASLPAIKPDCVVLIPGGVDVDRFRPVEGKTAVRRRLGLPEEAFLLLTVRRLVPRMGVENLIHAFALLKDQGSTLHLVVGGQGRLMEALRHQAGELGLEASVTYTGFVPEDDLPAYYQAADLFVLPTAALEGFGLPTLEALASGLPVVGTPIGSTTEILTQFDARFLAKGTTATDLAEKIVEASRILQQEDVASRARAFAVAHYRWDSIVDRYEDLYQELCAIKRA
jgi:glycosyltransferase involved in cell wall biosynthesis